jgi:hypothetical protein
MNLRLSKGIVIIYMSAGLTGFGCSSEPPKLDAAESIDATVSFEDASATADVADGRRVDSIVAAADVQTAADIDMTDLCAEQEKGTQRACYSGPDKTRGVGQCKDGVQRCAAKGEFPRWSPCEGDVLPAAVEDCGPAGTGDGIDNDCDGATDEGCKPKSKTWRFTHSHGPTCVSNYDYKNYRLPSAPNEGDPCTPLKETGGLQFVYTSCVPAGTSGKNCAAGNTNKKWCEKVDTWMC